MELFYIIYSIIDGRVAVYYLVIEFRYDVYYSVIEFKEVYIIFILILKILYINLSIKIAYLKTFAHLGDSFVADHHNVHNVSTLSNILLISK